MSRSDELLVALHRLHPMLIDLSLDRIGGLLTKLGDPHRRLPPVVHIAGTNGKGSTTAYLKAMLEADGRRVHVYTSPHLVRFHERISVPGADGQSRAIAEDDLVRLLERVAAVNAGAPMTFFEITTAAALLAFAETPADAVLLEVGLGGRADATNVIDRPALCVITPVSIDHAEKLGGTLALIAREKAGILKPGVPAVIAAQDAAARDVLVARAAEIGAPLKLWGEHFDAFEQRGRLVFQTEDRLLDLPRPALLGRHQIVNAGTAVAAALALDAVPLSERAIERGLQEVVWPARMQRLVGGPLGAILGPEAELWLDGGHNPAAGQALAQTLADLDERAPKPVHLVCGMMGQKDAAGFLAPFRGLVAGVVAVPIPRAQEAPLTPSALAEVARTCGLPAEAADDVPEALQRVSLRGPAAKRVLICGSLYLAGHVLALQGGA